MNPTALFRFINSKVKIQKRGKKAGKENGKGILKESPNFLICIQEISEFSIRESFHLSPSFLTTPVCSFHSFSVKNDFSIYPFTFKDVSGKRIFQNPFFKIIQIQNPSMDFNLSQSSFSKLFSSKKAHPKAINTNRAASRKLINRAKKRS